MADWPKKLLYLAAVICLAGAGLYLRVSSAAQRPFHADEAVQGYQTWQLLRGEGYTYDPTDKHGPLLYYATAAVARIAGWGAEGLTEVRLRWVPILAGLGTLGLLAGTARRLGPVAAIVAVATVALAPLAVIYDTMFIQEAWFACFTWALFVALWRTFEAPTSWRLALVGLLIGLMQATKETSVLHFAALAVAVLAAPRLKFAAWPRAVAPLAIIGAVAALVYVAFYSAGFTRWSGLADGVRTYFHYADRANTPAHNQPWTYYLQILWPHTRESANWGQPAFLLTALAGAALGFFRPASPFHRALALLTLGLLVIYSAIPYKTPWLLLTPSIGLALLAGIAIAHAAASIPRPWGWLAATLLAALVLGESARRNVTALGRYASDSRNPYLYQSTSPQFSRLVSRLRELQAAAPRPLSIAVVSPDHAWPLPWYLRGQPQVGYFEQTPQQRDRYDVVITDSRLLTEHAPVGAQFFGLRPDVVLALTRPAASP